MTQQETRARRDGIRECGCPPWVVECTHLPDNTIWILASTLVGQGHEDCTRVPMYTSTYSVARITGYRPCMDCTTGWYGQLLADHTKKGYTYWPPAVRKYRKGAEILTKNVKPFTGDA